MSQQDDPMNPDKALEPEAMERKPFLQALSWFTGVVAGGTVLFLLVVKPSVVQGATRAGKAMWQLRHGQTTHAALISEAAAKNQDDCDAQQPTAP